MRIRETTENRNEINSSLLQSNRESRISYLRNQLKSCSHDWIKWLIIIMSLILIFFLFFFPKFIQNKKTSPLLKAEQHDSELCASASYQKKIYNISSANKECLGPPYIYMTYHGGKEPNDIQSVCKYTRDGCSLGTAVHRSFKHEPRLFRDMLIYEPYLIVTESYKKKSRLLIYDQCNFDSFNKRHLLSVEANPDDENTPLVHPYGLAMMPNDSTHLYVSAQGTNTVLRYKIKKDCNETTICLLYDKLIIDFGQQDIRGIVFDSQSRLYIANKEKGVLVYTADGDFIAELPIYIPVPIFLYYHTNTNTLLVGSKGDNKVYEINTDHWELIKTYQNKELKHPAGMLIYEDSLYVVSQEKNMLLQFSVTTGDFLQIILPTLTDAGESIIIGDC